MNQLDLQIASYSPHTPTQQHFQQWIDTVLNSPQSCCELLIRLVDEAESAHLNQQYRHRQGATNILSFPFDAPHSLLLGDLIICVPVMEDQAQQQQKTLWHHWAHIVIHGVLHLCGYNHIDVIETQEMEQKEIDLLKKLSIGNPYEESLSHDG